jgi:tRNA(Ile)-lysidine synthase
MQAVHACIANNVRAHESVAVAYSGGLDSTVLLHAASCVLGRSSARLNAIHVNHGLSPNASAWAEHCVDACKRLDVPIQIRNVHLSRKSGEGIEGEARRLRLAELIRHSSHWILLAHHADDQAETLLHNLMRGTGIRGAAAMPEQRERFLRPFLRLGRDVLIDYADAKRLAWVEDESNTDCKFTRNYLRAKVLPALRDRFPMASEQLAAAAERFAEANQLLEELALKDLDGTASEFPLLIDKLKELSDARARNLLRAMLAWQGVQAPDESRLREFLRQVRSAGNDKRPSLDLPTYRLWGEKRLMHFERRD